MISKEDQYRIQVDAVLAIDALRSIEDADELHPNYIREKIRVAKRCVEFIESFIEAEEK
jgi:hypothetical protein